MSTIANASAWLANQFEPVSLSVLNARAEMMERLDNKYIVNADVLRRAAAEFSTHFDILEIGCCRAFTYETCYFDNETLQSYFDHHQGRRRRVKVRMRKYIEAGLCFIEVKLKDKRGITIKKRLPCDAAKFGSLDAEALHFVHRVYFSHYQQAFPYELSRVMDMRYRRMTLVAKEGGERMTIDGDLSFQAGGLVHAMRGATFVLETKSANGNGIADRILRGLHQHPTKHCSKYCACIAEMKPDVKHNRFLPVLRKFGSLPVIDDALGMMSGCLAAIALALVAALALPSGASAKPPATLEILGRLDVPAKGPGNFIISELSGLAWDADQQLLYAVSDRGELHHFRLKRTGAGIAAVEAVFSTLLSAPGNQAGGRPLVNAEGLAALNSENGRPLDSELLVAFEDGPAIARFTTGGRYLGAVELPAALGDPGRYAEKNSRLEAVAFDARHGILTGPEEALVGTPDDLHTIFASSGAAWSFKTFQPHRSNLKALDSLPNGALLVLERTRLEAGGNPTARLRYLDPADCQLVPLCTVTELEASPSAPLMDNFEGMTQLSDTEILLVTDRKRKDANPAIFLHLELRGLP